MGWADPIGDHLSGPFLLTRSIFVRRIVSMVQGRSFPRIRSADCRAQVDFWLSDR